MFRFLETWLEEREQKRINKAIQRELDKSSMPVLPKFLLLGAHESGKSTFIKQMKILYSTGYSQEERSEFRELVYRNVFSSMQAILQAMGKLKIPFSTREAEDSGSRIMEVMSDTVADISAEHLEMLKLLWADSGVQACYARSREYQLNSSAGYFLDVDDLDRLGAPGYVPTEQDVLHVNSPTAFVMEYTFRDDRNVMFKVVDCGGSRSVQRRWIYAFEDVTGVIFLAAINEFDQMLAEAEYSNRLEECRNILEVIASYDWFKNTPIYLFLNKSDLLEEKICMSHLEDYFPEYDGKEGDAWAAREFIRKYLLKDLNSCKDRPIYWHYTCATDTENMKEVFESILDETVRDQGLRSMDLG